MTHCKTILTPTPAAAECAALPTANDSQYISHCKPLLFWFPVSGGV